MEEHYVIKTATGFYVYFEGNLASACCNMVHASIIQGDCNAIIGRAQAEKRLGVECKIYKINLEEV